MDGLETLRRLKKRVPDVPVVMLSGHGQARQIVEAMQLGAADFLRKPFEAEELQVAFQKALETRALRQEVEELRGQAGRGAASLILADDDESMREVRDVIEQVADTDITVLDPRRERHRQGGRGAHAASPLGAARQALREGELRGAALGAPRERAVRPREGRLHRRAAAQAGQVRVRGPGHHLPRRDRRDGPALQAKLLQVLQDGEFSRLGGESDVQVDTRVIAATNRDLEEAVESGEFREDLYYRLNVVTVQLPPLRERTGDIPLLVEHFLRKFGVEYNREPRALSREAVQTFLRYHWPGNVRELENMVRRMIVLGSEHAVLAGDLAARAPAGRNGGSLQLDALDLELEDGQTVDLKSIAKAAARVAEKRVIARMLDQTRWNRKEAAERLQISYKALLYKMKESGLSDEPVARRGSA